MKKVLAFVMALVMMAAVFTACGESANTPTDASSAPLKIGFIGPLTGGAAVYGNAAKNGAEIAVNEINALGGLQIELNTQDDEHDAEKSVNAYNNLMDWGMQVLCGSVTTTPCLAVSKEAYIDRVFTLTPSASSADVPKGKDNVYQICFTDPMQGTKSAQYIAENFADASIAIIYNNGDAYSTGIFQTFQTEAASAGLNIVSISTCTDDTNDFSVQVADAKNAGADLVFMPIYYTPASLILNQARSIGYEPTFFGVDGMDGILTMPGFDTSLAEGVMLLTPFAAGSEDPKVQSFVAAYQQAYGETPNQFAADAYDCIYAIYNAFTASDVTTESSNEDICTALMNQFNNMKFSGLTGTDMTWTNGEVDKAPAAVVIENGIYKNAN